nr:MAG TPA: hypothetical protein [Microviridae sp.]
MILFYILIIANIFSASIVLHLSFGMVIGNEVI